VADEFTPTLDQLTLAAYLRSGEYDRHVRKARAVYRGRRDRLMEELARLLPDLAVTGLVLGYGRLHESAALYVVRALEAILRPCLQAGPGAQPADLVTQGAG
jgi:DNA-binding transcriptional MocR family regulator